MSVQFVYQYLYRGRPESGHGSGSPDWSVVLGRYVEMPGLSEPRMLETGPLTPEQAAAAGFPLSGIIDGINAAALADRDAQAAALVAMTAERDRLAAQVAELAQAQAQAPEPTPEPTPEPEVEPVTADR
jgi:hypothetical protein